MILHFILNSILVFFCLALACEAVLLLLNVKNLRIQLLCRSLPFFKIPFDILIFLTYGDSLLFNANPFSCEVYVCDWIALLFPLMLPQDDHLIIPQYLAGYLSAFWLMILTMIVCSIALLGIARKLFHLHRSQINLRNILQSATPFQAPVHNQPLNHDLEKLNAKLLISSEIEMPFASHPHYILIPEKFIKTLTQDELEAVIAHELQHIKWRDPLLKFFYSLICSLCWWIPSDRWLNQLVDTQEQASDAAVSHYGIDELVLANAMTKVLRDTNHSEYDTLTRCFLGSTKNAQIKRLQLLLNQDKNNASRSREWLALTLSVVTFLSFWMC